jgi:hypothetical protein
MVATQHKQKKKKSGGRSVGKPQATTEAAGKAAAGAGRSAGSRGRRPKPAKVGGREAGVRIRALADTSTRLEVRRRLRRLAGQVARGPADAQRMTFLEAEIAECLDEAQAGEAGRDRWLLCEAAAWALGWMARTKRAGGSAGGLLERLVQQARAAQTGLGARDTQSARFVLLLARLFRDIEACRCLEEPAVAAVREEIGRLVTAAGAVGLSGSENVLERVVRWTNFRAAGLATGPLPWDEATEAAWSAAAVAALRLLGGRGRMLAGAGRLPGCFSQSLLTSVAAGPRRQVARAAARSARTLEDGRATPKCLPRDFHDPAAAVAILRSGWERGAVRVLVEYREATPRLEIAVDDRLLVAGPWQWSAAADGRPLDAEGGWKASCWESDRKATFLEITAPLTGSLQIERQVVVLPGQRLVLLADAIVPRTGAAAVTQEFRYRGTLPLAAGLDCDPEPETREILVSDTEARCMVLPLALPEWRAAGRGGLTATADGVALEQQGGLRLYAPLWIDCDAARIGRPRTWRQLTVADTRRILPPHQAVGFRVQAGREQWLVYRALDVPRNRTLLGCNVSCEFLVGRVKRSGEVARTLEIQ